MLLAPGLRRGFFHARIAPMPICIDAFAFRCYYHFVSNKKRGQNIMANQTKANPPIITDDMRQACVAFLAKKGVAVGDATDSFCLARAMLSYMHTDKERQITSANHALRIIAYFYNSRIVWPLSKKEQKAKALAKRQKKVVAGKPAKQKKAVKTKRVANDNASGKKFYASAEWKRVRYDALKRSSGRCECCGVSPHEGAILNVDHIKPMRYFPALALEVSNLQVLCGSCNQGKGARDYTDWRKEHVEQKTSLDRDYERIMANSD